jgi:hypothetical protein
MTLAQMIAMVREIMNAVSSTQWSDSTLQTWIGVAHWAEWANLLNINPQYYMQSVTVTQDTNGQFAITDLNVGSGDSKTFCYRIQTVAQPAGPTSQVQYFYRQSQYRDYPNPQPNTALPYVWYQLGQKIQILPVAAGQSMTVTTSYRPPRADTLSATSVTVDFPMGYAELVPWSACEAALLKGGSEVQAARDITAKANTLRELMLQDLGRFGPWPIVAQSFDLKEDWAG